VVEEGQCHVWLPIPWFVVGLLCLWGGCVVRTVGWFFDRGDLDAWPWMLVAGGCFLTAADVRPGHVVTWPASMAAHHVDKTGGNQVT
jgi:hypothetical protein